MKINFFDLSRQYAENQLEIEDKVLEVLRSCNYIMGNEVEEFEKNIASYLGVKHAISVNSGTDALTIALKSLGVGATDEVITSPFTFFATAEAIANLNAVPVFVDIEENTYLIDPQKIEEKITDKTKVILPVHVFGKPADMDKINMIAKKYNLKVLDDACQAIGSVYKNEKIGSGKLSSMSAFSFYPTKNLGAFGDGGLITTNNDEYATIAKALRAHAAGKLGLEAKNFLENKTESANLFEQEETQLYDPYKYYNYLIGFNSRLDSIQAAILNLKLSKLDMYNRKRKEIAQRYIDEIDNSEIILPLNSVENEDVWHQFALKTNDKNDLIQYLESSGIGVGNFYPVPLHLQKAFDYLKYKDKDLPVALDVCNKTVCLPIYPELKEEEVDYIINKVNKYERIRKR